MHKSVEIVSWPLTIVALLLCYAGYVQDNWVCYLLGMALIGMLVLLGLLKERQRREENAAKPITTVEATVISHHIRKERVGRNTVTYWYIAFRPADGSPNLEFQVSQLDFEDFDVGESGPLRYRGWEFLSFGVKDKSGMQPMAPLPEEYESKPEPKSIGQKSREALRVLWTRLTSRTDKTGKVPERDDGILTHEIDE